MSFITKPGEWWVSRKGYKPRFIHGQKWFEQLCEKDKELTIAVEKKADINGFTFMFWLIVATLVVVSVIA